MEFHYDNNPITGVFRIRSITYGGEANLGLSVEFITESRADSRSVYASGVRREQNARLQKIAMKVGGLEVRNYQLSYQENAFEPAQTSYLNEIALCSANQSYVDCQKTYFDWTETTDHLAGGQYQELPAAWGIHDQLVDINQDGLVDIVKFAPAAQNNTYAISQILIADIAVDGGYSYASRGWQVPAISSDIFDPYYNQVMDVNGDGYPDLVALQNDYHAPGANSGQYTRRGLWVALSNGQNGFDEMPFNLGASGLYGPKGTTEVRAHEPRDTNNDGIIDLFTSGDTFRFPCPGNLPGQECHFDWGLPRETPGLTRIKASNLRVSGTQLGSSQDWHEFFDEANPLWRDHQAYVDLNGDGFTDIIRHGGISAVDQSDLQVVFLGRSRSDSIYNNAWSSAPIAASGANCMHRYTGDVNGDGLPDIVANCKPGSIVIINTGDGAAPKHEWWDSSTSESHGDTQYYSEKMSRDRFQMIDINADGLQDIVFWDVNCSTFTDDEFVLSGRVCVRFSNGHGFDAPVDWTNTNIQLAYSQYGKANGSPRFADFNGDGLMDVAPLSVNNGSWVTERQCDKGEDPEIDDCEIDPQPYWVGDTPHVYLSQIKARRLEGVRQQQGGGVEINTQINYANLIDKHNGVYESGTRGYQHQQTFAGDQGHGEQINPRITVPHAKWVVESLVTDNGIGGQNETQYNYAGLSTHRYHGSLGFARRTVTNALGYKTVTYYSQDFQYGLVGSVVGTETFAPNGLLIMETENQYGVECLNGLSSECFRDEAAIDELVHQSSQTIVPHVRISLLSQNIVNWTINTDADSNTLISRSRMSLLNGILSCPSGDWEQDMGVLVYDKITSRSNHDGFGRALLQDSIVCDEINMGTFKRITLDKQYAVPDQNLLLGIWLNGLEIKNTTRQAGFQSDGFDAGFKQEMTEQVNMVTAVYNQGMSGTDHPRGSLRSTTIEAGTEGEVTTTITYDVNGEIAESTKTIGSQSDSGGMQGITSMTTNTSTIYIPGQNGYKQITVTEPGGEKTTARMDNVFGAAIYGKDSIGIISNNKLDKYGRVVQSSITSSGKNIYTNTSYKTVSASGSARSLMHSKTDGKSPTRIYLDLLAREVSTWSKGLNGEIIRVFTNYDAYGRVSSKSLPWNQNLDGEIQYTHIEYDTEGRVERETAPDGGVKENRYDGLMTIGSNALGQIQKKTKNALNLLIKSEDESGSFVTYAYNAADSLIETRMYGAVQAAPVITTMDYDNRGNRISLNDPNTGAWFYAYNVWGLLYKQTDAKGDIIEMNFDHSGRMVKRYDNGIQSGDWTYNIQGQLIKTKLNDQSDAFQDYLSEISYNSWGMPVSQEIRLDGVPYKTQTFYDEFNRPRGIAYPDLPNQAGRLVVQTDYSVYGQPNNIRNAASQESYWQAGAEIDNLGNLTEVLYGNGLTTYYDYDHRSGRLLDMKSRHQGRDIFHQSYVYNKIGNLKHRQDWVMSTNENFCYDDLNRLIFARETDCIDGNQTGTQFGYDSLGNIKYKSSHAGENKVYQYDGQRNAGPHAVSSISDNGVTRNYHYDRVGQLLQVTEGANTVAAQTWTVFGKPEYLSKNNTYNKIDYGPDRKRYKREDVSDKGTRSTYYAGGMFEVVAFVDKDDVVKQNQYRHYIGEVAVYTYSEDARLSKLSYRHIDHLGSLIGETEHIGKSAALSEENIHRYRFDAWGKRVKADGSQLEQADLGKTYNANKGFTGHEMLEETGLIHMNGRVYDPDTARFLSPDPLVQAPDFTQSFNRYTYVWNNPLSLTDPTGYGAEQIKVTSYTVARTGSFRTLTVTVKVGNTTYTGSTVLKGNQSVVTIKFSKSGASANSAKGVSSPAGDENRQSTKEDAGSNNASTDIANTAANNTANSVAQDPNTFSDMDYEIMWHLAAIVEIYKIMASAEYEKGKFLMQVSDEMLKDSDMALVQGIAEYKKFGIEVVGIKVTEEAIKKRVEKGVENGLKKFAPKLAARANLYVATVAGLIDIYHLVHAVQLNDKYDSLFSQISSKGDRAKFEADMFVRRYNTALKREMIPHIYWFQQQALQQSSWRNGRDFRRRLENIAGRDVMSTLVFGRVGDIDISELYKRITKK